jgi:hypothetical protein
VAALTLTAALFAHAGNDRADVIMDQTLHGYQQPSQHGQWINPWMPTATSILPRTQPSADQKMVWIIAIYTREVLDRGGWVNTVMTNSQYASGNPLSTVRVGEGLTWRVPLPVVERRPTVAAWNTPNLDAFDPS